MTFFDAYFLWKEAVASSLVLSITLAVVGSYAMLRRVVFLPAALSQLSGLGVMLAFWLVHVFAFDGAVQSWGPLAVAMVITFLGAMVMGKIPDTFAVSREAVIGVVYVLSSALIIALANSLPEESHHVDNILFGNAVLVDPMQMRLALGVSLAVLLVHVIFKRQFMFVAFDSETATVHGLQTRRLDMLLFVTLAGVITVSTKTIGALPTFAFSVLPPWFAIQRFKKSTSILLVSAAIAAIASFVGYWVSFQLDLPTGAATAVLTGFLVVSLLLVTNVHRIPKRIRSRRSTRTRVSNQSLDAG